MTTREVHESKLIERAFDGLLKRDETKRLPCQPAPFWFFDKGYRAGYTEGLKWQDNKKQIVAEQLKAMLDAYQAGQRGLPSFGELVDVMRLVEGDAEQPPKWTFSFCQTSISGGKPFCAHKGTCEEFRSDADRMLAEDIAAVKVVQTTAAYKELVAAKTSGMLGEPAEDIAAAKKEASIRRPINAEDFGLTGENAQRAEDYFRYRTQSKTDGLVELLTEYLKK